MVRSNQGGGLPLEGKPKTEKSIVERETRSCFARTADKKEKGVSLKVEMEISCSRTEGLDRAIVNKGKNTRLEEGRIL